MRGRCKRGKRGSDGYPNTVSLQPFQFGWLKANHLTFLPNILKGIYFTAI